jgi:hypothetical protein
LTKASSFPRKGLCLESGFASDDKNAEAKAMREFNALHRLQLYSWAPRILDSY